MMKPIPFRDRPRVVEINDDDVFVLSRIVDAVPGTYSITWASISDRVSSDISEARSEVVDALRLMNQANNDRVDRVMAITNQVMDEKQEKIPSAPPTTYFAGDHGWHELTKACVGLDQVENVPNKDREVSDPVKRELGKKVDKSVIGVAGGLVPLGQDIKISAEYLPSYVDDVIEVDTSTLLPAQGDKGKIYVVTDSNLEYRWSGTGYVQLVSSPGSTDAVAEGARNLYFTAARAVTALGSALAQKAAAIHGHAMSEISGLADALLNKAEAKHTHSAADIATGNLDPARLPVGFAQRIEYFNSISDVNGLYTVVFAKPFASTPSVQPVLVGNDTETQFRIVSRSKTGFQIHVYKRASATVLGLTLLTFAVSNVASVAIDVRVEGT